MKITSCELIGFRRMQLSNVASFTIKPTEPIQLILGTNGSGKSSLMGELTPLPANSTDYFKDGSKVIGIIHRGQSYRLVSTFSGGQKHEFWVGEENLNEGRTVTVQKELVRQHFGITLEVQELLVGLEKFTQMSPTRRREWFTKLCDTNYDYAIAVFKRLATRLRDTTGALKLTKKRLVSEQAKVISPAEEEKLMREVQEIGEELNLLQANRAPVERASEAYQAEIEQGLQQLEVMSQKLLRVRFVPPYRHSLRSAPGTQGDSDTALEREITCLEDVSDALEQFRHDISVNQELISKAAIEHRKIEETVTVLKRTGAEGVSSLQLRRQALVERAAEFRAERKLLAHYDSALYPPAAAQQAHESVREQIQSIFSQLPANEDRRFSSQRQQELSAQILAKKDERARQTHALGQLSGQRSHMEAHKALNLVQCPSCNHRWPLGYSEDKYQELCERTAAGEESVRTLERQIEDLEREVLAIREYGDLYRAYVRTTQAFPVLRPLWDHIADEGYVARAPRMVLTVFETYGVDLQQEVAAVQLDTQVREVDALIRDAEQVGDASLAEQLLRLEEMTLHIESLTAKITQAQTRLSEYSAYKRQVLEAQELASRIEQLRGELGQANEQRVEMLRREVLHQAIRNLQHSLVRKEETLAAATLQKSIVADLEASIGQLELQEQAAEYLVGELSPTDGLIAEGLLGFIRIFVAQMNNLIRKIWSYPLQVKDCGSSDGDATELDYRFPLMVQTKENMVPDVAKGSTGMQEIVNLAFKVVAMQYLGLSESPLFLDEFASSFDEAHRASAMQALRTLMEQKPFTQMFMVSHFYDQYGGFTNSEVCVLSALNITVPKVYNQHVVIT